MDILTCSKCSKSLRVGYEISCQVCKSKFHKICAKVDSKEVSDLLANNKNIVFNCNNCFSSTSNLVSAIACLTSEVSDLKRSIAKLISGECKIVSAAPGFVLSADAGVLSPGVTALDDSAFSADHRSSMLAVVADKPLLARTNFVTKAPTVPTDDDSNAANTQLPAKVSSQTENTLPKQCSSQAVVGDNTTASTSSTYATSALSSTSSSSSVSAGIHTSAADWKIVENNKKRSSQTKNTLPKQCSSQAVVGDNATASTSSTYATSALSSTSSSSSVSAGMHTSAADWKIVENNKKRKHLIITGNSSNSDLEVVEVKKWFHLSSFLPTVTADNIIDYVVRHAGIDKKFISCYSLVKKQTPAVNVKRVNFKLGVSVALYNKVLSPDIWPANVSLRPFRFFRKEENQQRVI
ncbi:PREDICTED: uncharacterized protein LOC108367563 [Rhagoletis zephyria]|uniref:uncharacterized protein LOC108367563 n=1 Tax=Rhagoletis zephyria TaxID=28612 RepID=UPI000811236A|nr:PREDICTED: uncharacterized protein LOC108367563 [Rhagoletis zephyria]